MKTRPVLTAFSLIGVFAVLVPLSVSSTGLTVSDIRKMLSSGMGTNLILKSASVNGLAFDTISPKDLTRLKKAGAEDRLLRFLITHSEGFRVNQFVAAFAASFPDPRTVIFEPTMMKQVMSCGNARPAQILSLRQSSGQPVTCTT